MYEGQKGALDPLLADGYEPVWVLGAELGCSGLNDPYRLIRLNTEYLVPSWWSYLGKSRRWICCRKCGLTFRFQKSTPGIANPPPLSAFCLWIKCKLSAAVTASCLPATMLMA